MAIPQIQMRLQHAALSIATERGQQRLEQPRPTVNMKQGHAVQRFSTTNGRLEINQDRVWDALAIGSHLETMSKIYSLSADLARQGVGRIVEAGNQMAAIHLGGNPIASLAVNWQRTFPEFDFRGAASFDNIDLRYIPAQLSMETTPTKVQLDVQVNRPIHEYQRGKLHIYMSQSPKVEIIPPQIDRVI